MRHACDVQCRRKDRILASGEDLPAEGSTVAARELLIEAGSECQGGREGRRTLVPAYAVRPVAVVEGYEVDRGDRCEVMQRDGQLVLPATAMLTRSRARSTACSQRPDVSRWE